MKSIYSKIFYNKINLDENFPHNGIYHAEMYSLYRPCKIMCLMLRHSAIIKKLKIYKGSMD